MAWQAGKKEDVGFKGLGGVLSTDKNFSWTTEKYGLSPNQLPSDTWLFEVPTVQHGSTGRVTTYAHASAIASNSNFITEYSTSNPVRLVREDSGQGGQTMNHNNTLWLARDAVNGNRLRNWINPFNHLDSTGATSIGYTAKLYKDDGSGNIDTSTETDLSEVSMFFYYKEGALVFDSSDDPVDNSWETNSGEQLWLVGFRYTGPTYQPSGTPTDGQVMSYNSGNDELEWSTVTTSGGGGTDPLTVVLTNPNSFVACDALGNPDTATGSPYTNTATDIKVFRGTTQLTYNSTLADNKWNIQGTPSTSGITLGSSNSVDDEDHAGYNGHHTILNDSATVTYTIRVQDATGGGHVDLTITQSIDKLKKGSTGNAGADAYSATLSNEAHAFQANVAGTVTNFTGSKTSVRAYKGTQELNSVSTTPSTGQFKVTRSVTTGTYTPGSEDITGDEYISNDGTAISSDVVVVEFSINCENNTTIVKEQKLVKVYKGDQGTAGSDATVTVTNIENAFTNAGDKIDIGIIPDTAVNSNTTKGDVGLGNVDNTSDADKPISTSQQTALDAKAPTANPTFTGTVSGVTATHVGLSNVNNTADADKPISTAQQTALDAKAPTASPTFTGTVSGVTATHVGLGNVDNTADADKPVSTAQQTALNAKASLTGTETLTNKTINGATIDSTTTIDGTAASTVKAGAAAGSTANQDSTATILSGNLTGSVDGTAVATIKSGAAAGATANQDSTATILSGNLTGSVDGTAVATIKSGAAAGATALQTVPDLDASKITSGSFDVGRIPTITSSKISDLDISSDKADINSTSTKVVTGKAVFDQYGSSGGGGATDIEDLDNVTKVGNYASNEMLVYDSTSNSFKNTKNLSVQSVSAIAFNGSFQDVSANQPNIKIASITENSLKHGIIEVVNDFIIKLDVGQASGSFKTFQIRNGAGSAVFVVDESGGVRVNKYKSDTGVDKIEFESDKVKIHEDIKAVTGKFKDNSDVTRIDYSGTDLKLAGTVQYTGGSPATIKGPDADKLNIESIDDLDFKIASGGASSKSFKFYNNTNEVAKIDHEGSFYFDKSLVFRGGPGRIYDSGDNVVLQFSDDGSSIIHDPIVSTMKSSGDMVFQVDYDESTSAGSHSFQFKNGAGTEIANLNESGDLQIDGDLTLSGLSILNGDNEVTISVDADQNAIFNGAVRVLTGTFKNLMGNTCITMDGSTTDVSVASKLTTGGNIELGHASDTTIARSAAGTVTIEGKEVVTKNKIYDFKVCTYWSSSTTGIYIPFGGTLNESTTLTNNTYSTIYSAPYAGRVVRITSKEQYSNSGTSTLELYLNHSSTQTGTDMSVSSFTNKFNQDCPSDWTFSAGDTIAIKRIDTSPSYGTSLTVVFEFDAT